MGFKCRSSQFSLGHHAMDKEAKKRPTGPDSLFYGSVLQLGGDVVASAWKAARCAGRQI